jgi:hypothetical protein
MVVVREGPEMPGFDSRGEEAYVPAALRGYKSDSRYKRQFKKERQTFFYPADAGYNDPLTQLCVLDCLMRLDPDATVRSKYLWRFLVNFYPQVKWNPVVVGAVLSEIAMICEDNFKEPSQRPIIKSRDGEGLRYKLNPTDAGWTWFETMRRYLGTKTLAVQKAMAEGQEVKRTLNIWSDLPPRIGTEDVE